MTTISFAFFSFLKKVTPNGSRVHRFASLKYDKMKWAGTTNLVNEVYLNMSFAALINSYALSWDNFSMSFQSVFTILMDVVLQVWPIFVTT